MATSFYFGLPKPGPIYYGLEHDPNLNKEYMSKNFGRLHVSDTIVSDPQRGSFISAGGFEKFVLGHHNHCHKVWVTASEIDQHFPFLKGYMTHYADFQYHGEILYIYRGELDDYIKLRNNYLKQSEESMKKKQQDTIALPPPPDSLSGILATEVAKLLTVNTEFLNQIDSLSQERILEALKSTTRKVEVTTPKGKKIDVGIQHKNFPELLVKMTTRTPVYVVGPAGGGKTMGVEMAAKSLDLHFGAMSVGPQTTQSQIFGYMDATGKYVQTEFRRCFEKGGVFLFDEIDAGNPQVLTAINSALSNNLCGFPDGMVKKHDDFICVASGNTWGVGASYEYVGRNQIDAATLDRFIFQKWPYDTELEKTLTANNQWVTHVQKVRGIVEEKGMRIVVSPRASINGAKLLKAGVEWREVEDALLWKGLDKETKEKIIKLL